MPVFASSFVVLIVVFGCVFLWLIVQAIVTGVSDIVKHRNEIELKQTLADRGMSAEEIVRVVQSTPDKSY